MRKMIALLCVFLLVSGCANNPEVEVDNPDDKHEIISNETNFDMSKIQMTLDNELYEKKVKAFLITLVNSSSEPFYYETKYVLQIFKDDSWQPINPDIEVVFDSILYSLAANNSTTYVLNISDYTPYLEYGRYKIIFNKMELEFEIA